MTFWRRWIKRLPGSDASRLARRETKRAAKKALTKGGRDDIIRHTLEAAEIAESEGDADRLRKFSYALLRLGQYGQAWELGARAIDLRQQSPIPEWEGDDLADRSILVRAYAPRNSIGEELRLSRFIAPLAQRARRCIVLAESRLVPLLRRSFAGVDARPRGVDDDAVLAEVDVAAYYETIAFHTVRASEDMRHSFVTLNPDPSRVASIRQRYRPILDGPLIGISWWSSNKKKDRAPSLGWKEAGFVSLQYGDTAHDLEVLQTLPARA